MHGPGQHQRRRPRPQHYRSTSVPLSKIHITMPAPRWRQDQAHARPWPGPEHTAHQLANATCSSAWCTPGPVVPVHTEVPALRETANDAYDLL